MFFEFWSLCFLMYAQIFFLTAVRGNGSVPQWSPESTIDLMDSQEIATGILSLTAPGIVGGSEGAAEQRIHSLAAVNPIEGTLAQAELFASRRKFDAADREYRKALDMKPERIGVYFEIAEYYRDRGDAARMSEAIEAGAPLAPADHRLDYYRGIALVLGRESPAEADRELHRYLDSVPDNANVPSHSTVHEWLGKLYERQGQLDRAAQEYQAALVLDPRNKQAAEALKALQRR